MPENWCFWTVVLEKTLESPLDCKEIKPVSPKGNQSWIFIARTDDEVETPKLWPPDPKNWPWCWERLKAGWEGDDRGWDGWMASLTRWTWVWTSSGSWCWTRKPGMLQSMGSQSQIQLNYWTELSLCCMLEINTPVYINDISVTLKKKKKSPPKMEKGGRRSKSGRHVKIHCWLLDGGRGPKPRNADLLWKRRKWILSRATGRKAAMLMPWF